MIDLTALWHAVVIVLIWLIITAPLLFILAALYYLLGEVVLFVLVCIFPFALLVLAADTKL